MLKVNNISKTFLESQFSLKDISFHIPPGFICGLVGENGAGKTSLINMLVGLYNMDLKSQGSICINGYDMFKEEEKAKASIGVILDEPLYDKNLTIEQIGVVYGNLYKEYNNNIYLNYLEQFGLDKKKKIKTLSKGMNIKVQFAFALSHNGKLFIFDEPTAGLDKKFREEFLKMCSNIVSDGKRSIIISSHITEDLERIADYIGYIQEGQMLFFQTKEELENTFCLVKGQAYKCKLINKEAMVYLEENKYSSSALVINSKWYKIDLSLKTKVPSIREIMYFLVKGGRENAKDITNRIF